MSNIHMRSFWLGAHGSLFVMALLLLPVSLWFLFTVVLSGASVWGNWQALKEDAK